MANKIYNKYKEPRYAEFSRKDLVIDIKNGHLYYKSNIGIHRMASELVSDTFGATDTDIVINNVYNVGIPPTFKSDGIRLGDGLIAGNFIVSGSTSGSITSIGPSGSVHINNLGSGSISASGFLFANLEDSSNTSFKTVVYNTGTGKFFITGSYGGGGGGGSAVINTVSDTTGQTGIDFTLSAGDLTAVASGLDTDDDVSFASISSSGFISASSANFSNLPDGFQNIATYNSQSGQLFYTSSQGLFDQLDTFKSTGQRNGNSAITGSLVVLGEVSSSNTGSFKYLVVSPNLGTLSPTYNIDLGDTLGEFIGDKESIVIKNAYSDGDYYIGNSAFKNGLVYRDNAGGVITLYSGSLAVQTTEEGTYIQKPATNFGSTGNRFAGVGNALQVEGRISSSGDLVVNQGSFQTIQGNVTASGNISASGLLFVSASLGFQNVATYNSESGEFHYTSSQGLSEGLDTFKVTGQRNGDSSITGSLTVTGTIIAQEFHTEFISASVIFESGSTKFGDTSDDIHSFSGSLRITGSGDHYFTDGKVGIGTITPPEKLTVTGNISASGRINLDSGSSATAGDGLRFRNRADLGLFEHGFDLGIMAPDSVQIHIDSNDNDDDTRHFAIVKNHSTIADQAGLIFKVREDATVSIYSHLSASGDISASGKLFGGLTEQNQTNVVYYDTSTGELTQDTAAKLLDASGVLSSSAQIATDISGAFTSVSSSIAINIANNTSAINILNSSGLLSSSAQIATDISGAFNGITGSFLLNTTDTLTGDLTVTNNITASGNISASGNLFANLSEGFQNIATYNSESGQFFYTSSAGLASGLDTFKTTGLRTGDGFIDGDITGSNELLIQKSSGEGTPAFGTSNVAVFQNNDSNQDASIAIIAADSKKSQIHFGKHDDIDVGGIRYFHEDHPTAPDQLHLRVNGGIAGVFSPVLTSKKGLRLGGDTDVSGSQGDILSIQGQLGGNGLTISSSAGTRIKFIRGANNNQHLFEYFTGGTRKWSLGNAGESNDNFYLYNTDSNVKFIELIDDGNSTHIHTNVTASGAISASGNLFAGLSEATQTKIVYYNTDDGELTFEDGSKLLDSEGLLSSSAQIATDISGAFTSVSSSIATNIATNVTNITNNTSAINTLNAAGLISQSSLSSPNQGEAQLTINNVPQVTIDLGLQTTDNVTFNHITASGNIQAGGNISASGHLFASASLNNDTNLKTVVYNSESGQFFHTTLSPGDAVISVTTGDANTITIAGTATQPTVAANTAVVSEGSPNLVTGDHVHDFISALTSSLPYLTTSPFTAAGISGSWINHGGTNNTFNSSIVNIITGSAVVIDMISGSFVGPSASIAENIATNLANIQDNAQSISNNTTAINTLNSAGLISGSSLGTTGQGLVQLTTNGVAQTAVGLGLETTDNVTFTGITSSNGLSSLTNIVINADVDNNSNGLSNGIHFNRAGTRLVTISGSGNVGIGVNNPGEKLHVIGNISASNKIFAGLTEQNQTNVVYYDTATGELTQDTAVKLLDAEGILSGSSQIATDISGVFVAPSASIAIGISANSASIAALNTATGSFLLNTTDTLTGDLTVTNNITASNLISASGDIIGLTGSFHHILLEDASTPSLILRDTSNPEQFKLTQANSQATIDLTGGDGSISNNLAITTDHRTNHILVNGGTGDIFLGGHIEVRGGSAGANSAAHITASGNISASGLLYGGLNNTTTDNIVFYNTSDGELTYGSAGDIGGGLLSSSAQIATDISGAFTSVSASFSASIATNTTNLASITTTVGNNTTAINSLPTAAAVSASIDAVTGSFLLNTTDTLTGDLNVTNDITASGEITANTLILTSTTDASATSTGHAFQSGPTNSSNIIIDSNEVMARNNGVTSVLHLNPDGGTVTFQHNQTDFVEIDHGHVTASGNISASGDVISNKLKVFGNFGVEIESPSGGPRTHFGSTTDTDSFMTIGSFNSINNIDTKARDFHLFGTNTTTGFYFDESAGKFGIGTTSPAEELEIHSGSLQIDTTGEGIKFGGTGAPGTNRMLFTSANNLQFDFDGNAQFIGTDVDITAGADLMLRNADNSNTMRLTNEAASGTGANAGRIDIKANTTTKVSITGSNDGRIGIGTTTPKKALHVENSGILIDGGSSLDASGFTERFIIDTGASTSHTFLNFKNNNGSQLTVTSAGNISASGNLFASVTDSSDTSFKTVMYDTATGQFFRTGSYGGGGGGADNLGDHTATQALDMDDNNITDAGNITLTADGSDPGTNDKVIIGASTGFGTARQFAVYTNEGNIKIGPANNSFCHLITDMAKMYFRNDVANATDESIYAFDGNHTGGFTGPVVLGSYDTDLILRREVGDTTYNQIRINDDSLEIKLDNSIRFAIDGAGDITIKDPSNGTGDFVTVDSGVLKKRTAANVLADIGAVDKVRFSIQSDGSTSTVDDDGGATAEFHFTGSHGIKMIGTPASSRVEWRLDYSGTNNFMSEAAEATNLTNPPISTDHIIFEDMSGTHTVRHINFDDVNLNIFNNNLDGLGLDVDSSNKLTIKFGGGADRVITSHDTLGNDGFTAESGLLYNGSYLAVVGGDVIAFASSDKRLKDNVTPISNPIKKILQIGGYTFDWNEKQDTYEGHDVGVIAQEVEKVLPQVVETREDGYKAVRYEKMVPLLIEAIKDQQKQIDELKKIIKNGNS